MSEYSDKTIQLSEDGLTIRRYYFPVGSKRVPRQSIRSVRRVNIGARTGRARIWGTANPRYWANLDPGRIRKRVGFVLDIGAAVRPFVTPEDPGAFEAALREHGDVVVEDGAGIFI